MSEAPVLDRTSPSPGNSTVNRDDPAKRHDSKTSSDNPPRSPSGLGQSKSPSKFEEQRAEESKDKQSGHWQDAPVLLEAPITATPTHQHSSSNRSSLAGAGLHIQTQLDDSGSIGAVRTQEGPSVFETPTSTDGGLLLPMSSKQGFPVRSSSLRSVFSNASIASSASANSTLPSPYLAGMSDLTPLPSPMVGSEFSGPWPGSFGGRTRADSVENGSPKMRPASQQATSPTSPHRRRKPYGSLLHDAVAANAAASEEHKQTHGRNRSISEFKPEQLQNIRPRHVTLGSGDKGLTDEQDYQMRREAYLAEQRGLTVPASDSKQQLPSPPPSSSSAAGIDDVDDEPLFLEDGTESEYLEIHCGIKNKRRKFRQLRQLGQGTFSTVMLATREQVPAHPTPEIEDHLDPQRLVAVKIVQHGPAGGADGDRIETGLKREIEMLETVSHPCIIHLKAYEILTSRTLIVLTYCPGGDFFELASNKRDLLSPALIQRMFAELISAVRYLHTNWIVHRDIKLENVLVNFSSSALKDLFISSSNDDNTTSDPRTHPTPIITLTDLGLSRRIPPPPQSPLLETRCGSEDYAAPEILLGQPYDGRATDAWALGVLLFALMEGRLPFDPPPGKPERSRNTHRIARCDWIWCRFGDDDGEWDSARPGAKEFEGAKGVVEGLLRKVRMGRKGLGEIGGMEWVQEGIRVGKEGLKMREGDEDDELL